MKPSIKTVIGIVIGIACLLAIGVLYHLVTQPMAFVTVPRIGTLVSRSFELEQPVVATPTGSLVMNTIVITERHHKQRIVKLQANVQTEPTLDCGPLQGLQQGTGSVRLCHTK